MNLYNKYQAVSIPRALLDLDIADDLKFDLIKLLAYGSETIAIKYLSTTLNIKRENVKELSSLSLIEVKEEAGELVVSISPLFNVLYSDNTQINSPKQAFATNDLLDRISFLINRKITSIEIEKVNMWLAKDFTTSEIETAVHKSAINNVDNFAYIETVLFNSKTNNIASKTNNVKRNIDLY